MAIAITSSSGNYASADEVKNGYLIGRYNLERSYYGDMTDAAFSLEEGEVSEPIEVVSDVENAYYVVYRTYKSEEHFEANFDSIKYVYLMNYVGELTYNTSVELKNSISYTDVFKGLVHSDIRM